MLAGPAPLLQPFGVAARVRGSSDISVGTNTSVTTVDTVKPPITAIASGFCSSLADVLVVGGQ